MSQNNLPGSAGRKRRTIKDSAETGDVGHLEARRAARIVRERDKYRRMWATGKYGGSPGLRVAPIALDWAVELGSLSLTDWGCGDGQALRWFRENGLIAQGIDLVDVAHPGLGVVVAPLWDPGELPPAHFAFSADVLEHVPREDIMVSLEVIRERTAKGGFFQIATRPDTCGQLIGETLHLTVREPEWWIELVGEFFHVERHEAPRGMVRLWLRA